MVLVQSMINIYLNFNFVNDYTCFINSVPDESEALTINY